MVRTRLLLVAAAISGAALLTAAACTSFSSDEAHAGDDSAVADGQSPTADAAPDAQQAPSRDGAPPDGMVAVQGYFIDSHEASNAEYEAFVVAATPAVLAKLDLPSKCAFKKDFHPSNCRGNGVFVLPQYPATCIDWCDAYAYCKYRGKRLCGAIDGGSADIALQADSQWGNACSSGKNAFPYGSTFTPGKCITTADDGGGPTAPRPSGDAKSCQGSVAGLFDMAGNVWEWEDACEPVKDGGVAGRCRTRGGSFETPGTECNCTFAEVHTIDFSYGGTGVRCCAEP